MHSELNCVRQFHRQIGAALAESPRLLDHDENRDPDLGRSLWELIERQRGDERPKSELCQRALMALEELAEWIEAHAANDLVAAADAWADRAYVLLGDAVAAGLPAVELFEEVHKSNMTKQAAKQASGKGIKGTTYEKPDIRGVLSGV
jgi:predicted HAD superfamily Cof-like phosphohydrolase